MITVLYCSHSCRPFAFLLVEPCNCRQQLAEIPGICPTIAGSIDHVAFACNITSNVPELASAWQYTRQSLHNLPGGALCTWGCQQLEAAVPDRPSQICRCPQKPCHGHHVHYMSSDAWHRNDSGSGSWLHRCNASICCRCCLCSAAPH